MKLKRANLAVTKTLILTDVDDGIHTPLGAPGTPPPRYGASRQDYVYVPIDETEIELIDTDRVLMSREQGCIKNFETAGYITVTVEPSSPYTP